MNSVLSFLKVSETTHNKLNMTKYDFIIIICNGIRWKDNNINVGLYIINERVNDGPYGPISSNSKRNELEK